MQFQERLIVPGLGIVIVLAAFILGVPTVYKVLLGLLGLAAVGTYFAPHSVQVETRIAIAALGLVILLLITSTAFWLVLLSFGAIAALQIPHRHTLQRSPATIAWLNAVLKRRSFEDGERSAGNGVGAEAAGGGAGEEAEDGSAAGDGESAQAPATSRSSAFPGFVRMNVAGIGSSTLGILIVVSLFIPWALLVITYGEDETETFSYTLRGAVETLGENNSPTTFFIILLVLGLLSIASIVLPRVVVAIVAVIGFLVTLFSSFYFLGSQVFEKALLADVIPLGVGAVTLPHVGPVLAAFCFFVVFLLQLIPRLNRSGGKG